MRKETDESMEYQEESNRISPRSRATVKYVRYLLLLIMVMVALIFLFANRSQINGDNFRRLIAKFNLGISIPSAENGEIHFNSTDTGSAIVFKDGFAYASVEKLIVTDKKGTEFQNTPLGFRRPVLSANSRYILVYDNGGTGLMVADSFSVLFETNMEDPIVSAKMNANGAIVVVTQGEGYLSKVYVYDSSFKEVYRYRSLNRYILDAALSKDSKAIAVSAMNMEGADMASEILYFKLNKEEVLWSATFEQTPCVKIVIKDNGTVCGLFDWGMVSLSNKGKEKGRFLLNDRVLQCYSLDHGSANVFIVAAAENGDGTVVVCDEKGREKDAVALDFYAVGLDYVSGRIAVLGNQKCSVFNKSGKELWTDTPERATDVSFMGKDAVVVVSDTACVYNKIR